MSCDKLSCNQKSFIGHLNIVTILKVVNEALHRKDRKSAMKVERIALEMNKA